MSVFPVGSGSVHMGNLWKKMWPRSFNVNAPKEVREWQKEKQRATDRKADIGLDGAYDKINTLAAITGQRSTTL